MAKGHPQSALLEEKVNSTTKKIFHVRKETNRASKSGAKLHHWTGLKH